MRAGLSQLAVDRIPSLSQVHPKTGAPIVPLGRRANGRLIWPIMGAAEDDGGDAGKEDDAGKDDGDDGTGDGDGNDDGNDGDDGDDAKKDKQDAKLTKENARRRQENIALKKERDELAAKLKEIDDADKSENEKLTGTVAELTTKVETQEKRIAELALNNAFLSDSTHTWKNPKAALKLADLSDVTIDSEGNVEGLSEALKELAKSDPYLLKGKDDEDEDDDSKQTSTGQPPRKTKTKGTPERDNLLKKYPALRR